MAHPPDDPPAPYSIPDYTGRPAPAWTESRYASPRWDQKGGPPAQNDWSRARSSAEWSEGWTPHEAVQAAHHRTAAPPDPHGRPASRPAAAGAEKGSNQLHGGSPGGAEGRFRPGPRSAWQEPAKAEAKPQSVAAAGPPATSTTTPAPPRRRERSPSPFERRPRSPSSSRSSSSSWSSSSSRSPSPQRPGTPPATPAAPEGDRRRKRKRERDSRSPSPLRPSHKQAETLPARNVAGPPVQANPAGSSGPSAAGEKDLLLRCEECHEAFTPSLKQPWDPQRGEANPKWCPSCTVQWYGQQGQPWAPAGGWNRW
eukprot:EG_transcript_14952